MSASAGWPAVGVAEVVTTAAVAVGARSALAPVEAPAVVEAPDERLDPRYDVIVWDDPVNLMSYVVLVLRRVFGHPVDRARRLMLQVHHEGRAVVATEAREPAELHLAQLHAAGLTATLERAA